MQTAAIDEKACLKFVMLRADNLLLAIISNSRHFLSKLNRPALPFDQFLKLLTDRRVVNDAGAWHSQPRYTMDVWLNLASAHASDKDVARENREHRDDVATKMTPAQIAEAQRLAREFKPK